MRSACAGNAKLIPATNIQPTSQSGRRDLEEVRKMFMALTLGQWRGVDRMHQPQDDCAAAQNGRMLKKKRDNQPIDWASPCWPRPLDSIRTLATWVELMTLPGCTNAGSTVPEKRSTSTF